MSNTSTKRTNQRGRRDVAMMPNIQLSDATRDYIDEQLANARAAIVSRLAQIAEIDTADAGAPAQLLESRAPFAFTADELAQVLREIELGGPKESLSGVAAFFSWLPPFTWVCAILCILFGVLGLFAYSGRAATGVASQASSVRDLAKIFAGAIVGSTSTPVAAQVKRWRAARRAS